MPCSGTAQRLFSTRAFADVAFNYFRHISFENHNQLTFRLPSHPTQPGPHLPILLHLPLTAGLADELIARLRLTNATGNGIAAVAPDVTAVRGEGMFTLLAVLE